MNAAPKAPTLCPKCGSHRTEIVGADRDGGMLILRCNACGARSEVPNPAHGDGFASEIDAAAGCGDVLACHGSTDDPNVVIDGDSRRRTRGGWNRT